MPIDGSFASDGYIYTSQAEVAAKWAESQSCAAYQQHRRTGRFGRAVEAARQITVHRHNDGHPGAEGTSKPVDEHAAVAVAGGEYAVRVDTELRRQVVDQGGDVADVVVA